MASSRKMQYFHIPDNVSLPDYLLARYVSFGDRLALIDALTDRRITYRQLASRIRFLSSALYRRGLRKYDVSMAVLPNCLEYPIILLAVASRGAAVIPCNPLYTIEDLSSKISDAQVKCVFTTPDLLPKVKTAARVHGTHLNYYIVNAESQNDVDGCTAIDELFAEGEMHQECPVVPIVPTEDIALLPYSSGTTGKPKGVMLTHLNIVANIIQSSNYEQRMDRESGSVMMAFLPFFHIYGIVDIQLFGTSQGNTLIVLPRYDFESLLRSIEKYKVSSLPLVPPVAVQLLKGSLVENYDLSSLEIIFSGAAPFGQESAIKLREKLQVDFIQGYGLTETGPATHKGTRTGYKDGTVGFPLPNVECRIVDPETGQDRGANQTGELWMRGPNIMKGYWRNPEATANTLDREGWLRTGDIAQNDEDGMYCIVDRLKELIKYKGHQVAPATLEDILTSHPAVADAAVIGVPDEDAGELPKAFVVKKAGVDLQEDAIKQFVAARVSPHQKLRGGVQFVSSIPKSLSGKILRRELRQQDASNRKSQL